MLLINVNRWIDNDCSDKDFRYSKKYGQKLVLPDQDALNILFSPSGDTYYLDKKYNRVELWKEQNIKEKLKETVLLHFVQTKPWQEAWLYEKRPYIENLYAQYEKFLHGKIWPLERKNNYLIMTKEKSSISLRKEDLDSLYCIRILKKI